MQPMRTRQERCVLLQLPQHQFTVLCINPGLQLRPLLEGATSFARVWCPSITIRLSLAGDPLRIPGEQHFVEIAFLVEIATQVRKEEILNVSEADAHGLQKFIKILNTSFWKQKASNLKMLLVLNKDFPKRSIAQNFQAKDFEFSEYYF